MAGWVQPTGQGFPVPEVNIILCDAFPIQNVLKQGDVSPLFLNSDLE
jgi:hypothetical protein